MKIAHESLNGAPVRSEYILKIQNI